MAAAIRAATGEVGLSRFSVNSRSLNSSDRLPRSVRSGHNNKLEAAGSSNRGRNDQPRSRDSSNNSRSVSRARIAAR